MDQMDQIDQMDDFIFLITLKVHWVHQVHLKLFMQVQFRSFSIPSFDFSVFLQSSVTNRRRTLKFTRLSYLLEKQELNARDKKFKDEFHAADIVK